jgi:Stage II sporulation protein E (SpoIIE)
MNTDVTPFHLVTAIHSGDDQALQVLEHWCGQPIAALTARVADRVGHAGGHPTLLTSRALRWLVMYLRNRDPASYKTLRRETFVKSLVLATYRWLDLPWTDRPATPRSCPSEPAPDAYKLRSYMHPLEALGGDCWCQDGGRGNPLWVIVADVTGHGYAAYLLAAGLPHLWRSRPIVELRARAKEPGEVLNALGAELESVLPDETFVEAVLGRFGLTGEALLAAAGSSLPVLRRSRIDRTEFHSLGGPLLGLEIGSRDQRSWTLDPGDELLLATDGLFDQPCGDERRLKVRLPDCLGTHLSEGRDLHEAMIEVLGEALCAASQHNDITMVTLRRRERLRAPGAGDAAN